MTDRELVAVFWATSAAIPVILLVVWAINRGLQAQKRDECREILADLTREANEDLDAYRSITAPQKADSPQEQPTQQGQR